MERLQIPLNITRENKFGAIDLNISVGDFNELGFEFGDSLDLVFSNGRSCIDMPYYSGFYGKNNSLIICGSEFYHNVVAVISQGGSLWDELELHSDDSAVIRLNKKAKYLDFQEALSMHYSNNRNDYNSDEVFANFHVIKGGKLSPGMYFRGASACCDKMGRAESADKMCSKFGIKYALNLSDDAEHAEKYLAGENGRNSYYKKLYEDGLVFPMGLNTNYYGEHFPPAIGKSFLEMTKHDGPFLIHCVEGKDRTGFVCMILLALAGASLNEILDDYMISYDNYYGISREKNIKKYEAVISVKAAGLLTAICGIEDINKITDEAFRKGAVEFLLKGGLTLDDIEKITEFITK